MQAVAVAELTKVELLAQVVLVVVVMLVLQAITLL
jgi:hypothetical protein